MLFGYASINPCLLIYLANERKQNNEILPYMKLRSGNDGSIWLQVPETVKKEKEREERKFNYIMLSNIQEPHS